jgi:hypothetical protein
VCPNCMLSGSYGDENKAIGTNDVNITLIPDRYIFSLPERANHTGLHETNLGFWDSTTALTDSSAFLVLCSAGRSLTS